MAEQYGAVFAGSGAGGGTMADTLASSGQWILLLERGNFLPREIENRDPGPVFVDGRYISPDPWCDAGSKALRPQVHCYVGAATKFYGAALYCPRPEDFSLEEFARHAVDIWLTTENVPKPDGLHQELRKVLNHIAIAARHVLSKNFYMSVAVAVAGVAHQAGTCRFGTDPAISVLDVNCKAHAVDHLHVVDTTFLPSIGAVNPALTAMAKAIRVGEPLTSRMD